MKNVMFASLILLLTATSSQACEIAAVEIDYEGESIQPTADQIKLLNLLGYDFTGRGDYKIRVTGGLNLAEDRQISQQIVTQRLEILIGEETVHWYDSALIFKNKRKLQRFNPTAAKIGSWGIENLPSCEELQIIEAKARSEYAPLASDY